MFSINNNNEVRRWRRRCLLHQMRRMRRTREVADWWNDVDVDACEDQIETYIDFYKCRYLVKVAHAPGDDDIVAVSCLELD